MWTRLLAAGAVLVVLAGPAFAGECPKHVKKIDAAVAAGTKLSKDKLAEVKKLRDEGQALHKSKKHGQSLKTLAKAEAILGIK